VSEFFNFQTIFMRRGLSVHEFCRIYLHPPARNAGRIITVPGHSRPCEKGGNVKDGQHPDKVREKRHIFVPTRKRTSNRLDSTCNKAESVAIRLFDRNVSAKEQGS
jgi:hypothetical protein